MNDITDLETLPSDFGEFINSSKEKLKGKKVNMGDRIIEIWFKFNLLLFRRDKIYSKYLILRKYNVLCGSSKVCDLYIIQNDQTSSLLINLTGQMSI